MKLKTTYLILFVLLFFAMDLFAQVSSKENKGKLYAYWGWNRAKYSNSDIHFKGDTYDFTLYDVVAKDRQTRFALDPYFNPAMITIPQTNLRIGYFFHNNYELSVAVDHMKYVMVQNQHLKIDGTIQSADSAYNGTYNNQEVLVDPNFLLFEHTDGLNYINMELRRFDNLYSWKFIDINLTEGAGIGMLLPKTNCTLLAFPRNDNFHVAGYGLGAVAGLNINLWKYFFIQAELKGGFIHMPNIRTTPSAADVASQKFFFVQTNILFGAIFKICDK